MEKAIPRTEINDLIARVQAMPDLAKFELFVVLREELAGSVDREHPEVREIRERGEALDYMSKAIELLGLGPRQVPTQAQFDQLAKEREWPWNGARVIRIWERWRNATQAYLGTRKVETPAARKRRRYRRGPEGPATERHLQSLKTWLATDPEIDTPTAYDEFAEEHNKHLPKGAIPLARGSTIRRNLSISWQTGLRVARGEFSIDKGFEVDLAQRLPLVVDADTLVGSPVVALVLKTSLQGVAELSSNDTRFPTPVAHIRGHPAWLYEDIKLFRRALDIPKRKLDERQYSILSQVEMAARLELSEEMVRRAISEEEWDRVPQPEGAIGLKARYWRREKVEAWEKQKAKAQSAETDLDNKEILSQKQGRRKARKRSRGREEAARAQIREHQEK